MPRTTRRTGPRWVRAVSAATTVALAANGVRLRRRANALASLPLESNDSETAPSAERWRVIPAAGVKLRPSTRAALEAWAEAQGLDAVDIVPGDLPVERAHDLLRQVHPGRYRLNPLLEGRTAGHAMVVREEVAKRADLPEGEVSPAQLVEVARQVKRFAPRTSDLVVVPYERARNEDLAERRAVQHAVFDRYSSLALAIPAAQLAALGAGAVAAPGLGIAALATYLVQPALVLGRNDGGVIPRDLLRHVPLRWIDETRRLLGTLRADAPAPAVSRLADELRPQYHAELALGLDRFFEERRTDCPWCGSGQLQVKVISPDLIQHKPGRFELDECGGCGHIFQNPRLSLEGLDFYYRDFYDGYGGDEMERIFASESEQYEGRIDMVADHAGTPERWLDVGTGHGHFCLVAKGRWPDRTFEGVDMSSSIEEAADRGWVDRGHRGMFPELAPGLAGRYDVVSMHHYLEHTRDPKAELDAAAVALAPGGHLLVEVPDPECAWGRILGSRWLPWFQPQHQHFVTIDNLEAALVDRGFSLVARHRARSNQALDLVAGIWLSLGQIAPRPGMPWNEPATLTSRAWRMAVCTTAMPAMIVIAMVDRMLDAVADSEGVGNTYRVLARYDGDSATT